MFKNIIFLESKDFYKDILDPFFFKDVDFQFDGAKFYKNVSFLKKFDLVIYTIYSSSLYNKIIFLCKKNNIPTMLLMDGICEFSNFTKNKNIQRLGFDNYFPIIADYIAVVGERAKFYFNELDTTALMFLPPRVMNKAELDNFNHSIKKDMSTEKFLITTANTAYYDSEEFERLCNLLKKTISALNKDGYDYIFRIFDQRIIDFLKIDSGYNKTEGSFEEVVKSVGFVITTPSSIMLQAMSLGKPVGLLLYRDSPLFIQSGWIFHDGVNFQDTIKSMVSLDEKRMAFQSCEIKRVSGYTVINDQKNIIKNKSIDYAEFVNKNLLNMLNSKFNFNFEFFLRRTYWKLRKNKFLKRLRSRVMG